MSDPVLKRERRLIELLEEEHRDIFRALYEQTRFGHEYKSVQLQSLCAKIHKHLAAEFGVFHPRAAEALHEQRLLVIAGEEYQHAMTAISELSAADQSLATMRDQLEILLEIFKQHIDRTEGKHGIHQRTKNLSLDWDELATSYIERCRELDL